jgi:hypothetical protein
MQWTHLNPYYQELSEWHCGKIGTRLLRDPGFESQSDPFLIERPTVLYRANNVQVDTWLSIQFIYLNQYQYKTHMRYCASIPEIVSVPVEHFKQSNTDPRHKEWNIVYSQLPVINRQPFGFNSGHHGSEHMKAIQMAMSPIRMNQSWPSHSTEIILSTQLEYELNRCLWCFDSAQSATPAITGTFILFPLDNVDFMSTTHLEFELCL